MEAKQLKPNGNSGDMFQDAMAENAADKERETAAIKEKLAPVSNRIGGGYKKLKGAGKIWTASHTGNVKLAADGALDAVSGQLQEKTGKDLNGNIQEVKARLSKDGTHDVPKDEKSRTDDKETKIHRQQQHFWKLCPDLNPAWQAEVKRMTEGKETESQMER